MRHKAELGNRAKRKAQRKGRWDQGDKGRKGSAAACKKWVMEVLWGNEAWEDMVQ